MAVLINTAVSNNHRGVPILEDIPYLGYLFSSENPRATNTETVVMITPHIIRPDNYELITEQYEKIKKFEESRIKDVKDIDTFFEKSFIDSSETD